MSRRFYRFLPLYNSPVSLKRKFLITHSNPHLSLTCLNSHRGLFNTFWLNQVLVFCSVTVIGIVSC
ncbi:unnamed protein product [Hymenolepis diminuta]|uniref:Uncharacterized protein n=1 Tax=Hymenolepis diminuta TaxID=6216 RepID=A0A564YA76_HYMDI|nr:unnamed protein product [Hymenolepis diminuta]